MEGFFMAEFEHSALKKPFTCNECGKSFRTRQGLSGHIQFAHGASAKPPNIDVTYLTEAGLLYKTSAIGTGLSDAQVSARLRILLEWLEVETFCYVLKLKLNRADFKNFILTRLRDELAKGN
jgi:hypothetical protein